MLAHAVFTWRRGLQDIIVKSQCCLTQAFRGLVVRRQASRDDTGKQRTVGEQQMLAWARDNMAQLEDILLAQADEAADIEDEFLPALQAVLAALQQPSVNAKVFRQNVHDALFQLTVEHPHARYSFVCFLSNRCCIR
jgi:hypothetical protein